ncbi:MAG TPA: DUF6232 family protein [Methylophilus sp.]|nr:DUF6232 family protein [Methylophilus sp.]
MDRKVFFSDGGIIISDSRFIASGYIYNIRDITSVRLGVIEAPRWLGIFGMGSGLVLMLMEDTLFVVGGCFIALGVMVGVFSKTRYAVILETATGEHRVFSDTSKHYIERVICALDAAMVHRVTSSIAERVGGFDNANESSISLPMSAPLIE